MSSSRAAVDFGRRASGATTLVYGPIIDFLGPGLGKASGFSWLISAFCSSEVVGKEATPGSRTVSSVGRVIGSIRLIFPNSSSS